MSRRNMTWLAVVFVAAVIGWRIRGIVWALVAAVIVLVVSEVIERRARARRTT